MKKTFLYLGLFALINGCKSPQPTDPTLPPLRVAENGRQIVTADGKPFFWLGDTGWLLFTKLTREEAEYYLETRRQQGFNLVQAMLIHDLKVGVNIYGDSSVNNKNVAEPVVTEGDDFDNPQQYDYWDHVSYVIDLAAQKGIYIGLVPVWGSNVKAGYVNSQQAETYSKFLAERFGSKSNVFWMNGGDLRGSDSIEVWKTIGRTLKANAPSRLVTFHPRGRSSSSEWFHNEPWLDFNMFQSGHKSYLQDTSAADHRFGEDNWKYVRMDMERQPTKPTLDGEPSYEGIPHGLHDTTQPYWSANDIRRYAYWSVLEGGAGFTYGHNAVMQFFNPGDADVSYGPRLPWKEALTEQGAEQMKYVKQLALMNPGILTADESIVANQGEKYDRLAACRGEDFIYVYTYNGRPIEVRPSKIKGEKVDASWFNPRNGELKSIGTFDNTSNQIYRPEGEQSNGNDWVLILKSK